MNKQGKIRRLSLLSFLFLLGITGFASVMRQFRQADAQTLLADSKQNATQSFDDDVVFAESVTWHQMSPLTAPPARDLAALAYDDIREVSLLFGGRDSNGIYSDTWAWDGANWAVLTPTLSPSARSAYVMAFDSSRQRAVLFGGFDGSWPDSIWEWDGADWLELMPAVSPSGRTRPSMVYDVADRNSVSIEMG